MKKFVNLIGLIILAAIAGYGAYWYVLTNQAETLFKDKLAAWQKEHPNDKFTYDNISKEGFPSHIKIRIENPQYSTKDPESNGRFDIKILGSLTLSSSLWGKEKSVEALGDGTILFPPAEDVPTPPKLTWKGHNILTLESEDSGHFEIFKAVFNNGKDDEQSGKTPAFRSWKSSLSQFNFNGNIDAKTPIEVNGGPFESKIVRKEYKKDQEEIVFNFNQKDMTINAPPTAAVLSLFYYAPSDLGKVSFNVDGSLCFPSLPVIEQYASSPLSPRQAEACFKVDRADFTSDLGNSTVQNFVVSLQQDSNKWNLIFKGYSEGFYTKAYDESVRKSLGILLKDPDYLKQFVGDDKEAQKAITGSSAEIIDLLPNASAFGKVSMKLDMTGNAEIKDNVVDFGNAELRTLDYNIPPYNINLSSKANFKKNFSDPNVQGTLKVARYKQLIDQLTSYSNRVIEVYNHAYADAKNLHVPNITPDDIKKVANFLRTISDDPQKESSDLRVTFTYNTKEDWKVGTLSMPDFIEKAYLLYVSIVPTNRAQAQELLDRQKAAGEKQEDEDEENQ